MLYLHEYADEQDISAFEGKKDGSNKAAAKIIHKIIPSIKYSMWREHKFEFNAVNVDNLPDLYCSSKNRMDVALVFF